MDAYVNHVFNTSVECVFQEFKQGFFQVCDRDLVKLFRPKELQEVLVGRDLLDWEKLKQVQSENSSHYSPVFSEAPSDVLHPHVLYLNTTNDYNCLSHM